MVLQLMWYTKACIKYENFDMRAHKLDDLKLVSTCGLVGVLETINFTAWDTGGGGGADAMSLTEIFTTQLHC